jgi:hypothetical protein
MIERGQIRNRAQAAQVRDFSRIRFGKITPTDIDGFFEMGDRVFVFIELKYGGRGMPDGQRIAIERMADALNVPPRTSLVVIGRHDDTPDVDIQADACAVVSYRHDGRWVAPEQPCTVGEIITAFVEAKRITR